MSLRIVLDPSTLIDDWGGVSWFLRLRPYRIHEGTCKLTRRILVGTRRAPHSGRSAQGDQVGTVCSLKKPVRIPLYTLQYVSGGGIGLYGVSSPENKEQGTSWLVALQGRLSGQGTPPARGRPGQKMIIISRPLNLRYAGMNFISTAYFDPQFL